jgi:hypothetical protein
LIGDNGVEIVLNALMQNKTLSSLGLRGHIPLTHYRGNNISLNGIALISEALEGNQTLTELDIGGNLRQTFHILDNKIGGYGIVRLFNALEKNNHLKTICIEGTIYGDFLGSVPIRTVKGGLEAQEAISKFLETNRTLTSLDISSTL